MYTSTLSLTPALDGGGWLTPSPGRFTSGKETRYSLYRRMSGSQDQSVRERKMNFKSLLEINFPENL